MTSLLKTADDDPTLPEGLRSSELTASASSVGLFDSALSAAPATSATLPRPRRPRMTPVAAQAEVEALLATDPAAAADLLRRHVDRFATSPAFLLWSCSAFSHLAQAQSSGGLPDRELTTEAWGTLLCTVVLKPENDDRGLQLIDRMEQLYELVRRYDPPLGYQEQYDTALQSFAAYGTRSALAAANLLTATNPSLALQLAERSDDSLGRVLVCASAHCELGQFEPAAHLFVGSSRVDLQACKLEYSIVSPK